MTSVRIAGRCSACAAVPDRTTSIMPTHVTIVLLRTWASVCLVDGRIATLRRPRQRQGGITACGTRKRSEDEIWFSARATNAAVHQQTVARHDREAESVP